jgi:hypothetical protein
MSEQPINPVALATYRITTATAGTGFTLGKAIKGREQQVRIVNRASVGCRFEFQDLTDASKPVAAAPVANGAAGSVWLPGGTNFVEVFTMAAPETAIDVLPDSGSPDLEVTIVDGF